jgi:hypothetical protein
MATLPSAPTERPDLSERITHLFIKGTCEVAQRTTREKGVLRLQHQQIEALACKQMDIHVLISYVLRKTTFQGVSISTCEEGSYLLMSMLIQN